MIAKGSPLTARIPSDLAGMRLDRALAELFPAYSRARLQQWLRDGLIIVDGAGPRSRDKVHGGESVEILMRIEAKTAWDAQSIPLTVVHEDDALIVIDKPPGIVVHPGAGIRAGTLVNGLLHRYPELASIPRAGIVHRLDKDTSGLLVIARGLAAHKSLAAQLQSRTMGREYDAVVQGVPTAGGEVRQPIGRHPVHRTRMAVRASGRNAVSHYQVVERFRAHARIRVRLDTGRTHQIRVHMAHIRHPLVGDPVYGGRLRIPAGSTPELEAALRGFRRQALHAGRLTLIHPADRTSRSWTAPLPGDLERLIAVLRDDSAGAH